VLSCIIAMADEIGREQRPKRSDLESSKDRRQKKSDVEAVRESKAAKNEANETAATKPDTDAGQNVRAKRSDSDTGQNARGKRSDSDAGENTRAKRSDSDVGQNSRGKRGDSDVGSDSKAGKRSDSDLEQDSKGARSDSDVGQDSRFRSGSESVREFKPRKPVVQEEENAEPSSNKIVNLFNYSTTDFPGAWPEDDIYVLLDAWEQAVYEPKPKFEPGKLAQNIINILKAKEFPKEVTIDGIIKQMNTLKNTYYRYLDLKASNVEQVEGACVPQLNRIMKKMPVPRRGRNKFPSYGSGKTSDVEEITPQNGTQPDDQNPVRNRRVRFQQRQNLQRSVRAMIASQKTLSDNFQLFFQKLDDSYGQIIHLLGEMVALQTIRHQTTLMEY